MTYSCICSCSEADLRRQLRFIVFSIGSGFHRLAYVNGWDRPHTTFAKFKCSATAEFEPAAEMSKKVLFSSVLRPPVVYWKSTDLKGKS